MSLIATEVPKEPIFFMGHSEMLNNINPHLVLVAPTIFQLPR